MRKVSLLPALSAEVLKIRRTPLPWLVAIGGTSVALLLSIVYGVNSIRFSVVNTNIWVELFRNGYVISSMVLIVPYVVLVVSTVVQVEDRASAWKYLYSLPVDRYRVFIAKVGLAVIIVIATYLVFLVSVLAGGFVLGLVRPELELLHYAPPVGQVLTNLTHSFISILGIIGIQFWVSMRWNHFVISIGVGILGFISSLIMFERIDWAKYFPYNYHLYLQNDTVRQWASLAEVEVYSLLCFVVFLAISLRHVATSEITS